MPKDFKKRGDRRRPKKNQDQEPVVDAVLVNADPSLDVFTSNADYISLSNETDLVPAAQGAGAGAGPSTHPDRLRRSGKQVKERQQEGSEARARAGDGDEDERREFVPGPTAVQTEIDLNAPFGFVDPDIKAYFKSVDEKLVEFSSLRPAGSSSSTGTAEEDGGSEMEDRTNFLHSALNEVRGMELQLATDGDTALVLERLIHSMGDWGRRVLMDSFGGRWGTLISHRFGSHVCQTLIGLAAGTIHRESRGVWPVQHLEQSARIASASASTSIATSDSPAEGHLRTATHLLLSLIDEILPLIPTLLTSPFASPPIRLLLIVLTPHAPIPSSSGSGVQEQSTRAGNKIRSAKSRKFRKDQAGKGGMRSILHDDDDDEDEEREEGRVIGRQGRGERAERTERVVPPELQEMRTRIREFLAQRLKGPEWRAMGVENAGGPVIQMLLEVEAQDGEGMREGSILDHLTSGLVAEQIKPDPPSPTSHDYLPSLLRDTTGSHLLQTILLFSPRVIFTALWSTYFIGKVGKMAGHPIGNYVVSSGIKRLETDGLRGIIKELEAVGVSGLIRLARTSVLKALVERSVEIGQGQVQAEVVSCICKAFELETFPEKKLLVPCALTLNVLKTFRAATTGEEETKEEPVEEEKRHGWKPRQPKGERSNLMSSMQGAILLQAMFQMDVPAIETVINSLLAQTVDDLLHFAHSPISSHVLDAFLLSPKVPAKSKRRLLLAFDGKYFELVDNKYGSRVGDTIWDKAADGFMKEKIARSLSADAIALSTSEYGRFFYRKLNLPLFTSKIKEWREIQLKVVHHFHGPRTGAGKAAVEATQAQVAEVAKQATPKVESEIAGGVTEAIASPTADVAATSIADDAEDKAATAKSNRQLKKERKEKKRAERGTEDSSEQKDVQKRARDSEDEIDDMFAAVEPEKKKKKKARKD